MNKLPLVSVIVPNYNHAKFLDERIQSVLNQTYKNFEVIILDDKSSDNSLEIINKYRENSFVSHIIVNSVNSGSTFKQWHKGFELAKGEVVWIAESDDSCDKHFLETLVNGYVANDAVLAFCRSCKYDVAGNKEHYELQDKLACELTMSGPDFISEYMILGNLVANASSAIFNRNLAIAIDRQYMTMRGEGDFLFWIELMEHGNVFFCDKALNLFRFHTSNTTSSLTFKGINPIEHKVVFDYLVKHNHITGLLRIKERWFCICSFFSLDYESKEIKKRVVKTWDPYGFFTVCYFLARLKGCIFKKMGWS